MKLFPNSHLKRERNFMICNLQIHMTASWYISANNKRQFFLLIIYSVAQNSRCVWYVFLVVSQIKSAHALYFWENTSHLSIEITSLIIFWDFGQPMELPRYESETVVKKPNNSYTKWKLSIVYTLDLQINNFKIRKRKRTVPTIRV